MGSPLNIFGGPCIQASLYDSTNGLLHLGYIGEDVTYGEDAQNVGVSDGNLFELHKIANFSIPLFETDGMISDISSRRGYAQEVWLIGLEMAVKITDVFVAVAMNRSYVPGETHQFILTGRTADSSKFSSYPNLLGTYGNCNVDTNTDNVADGWTDSGCTELAVTTSHKAGRGNEQQFRMGSGDSFYIDTRCPLDEIKIKITISAYVKERLGSTGYYNFGLKTLNSSDVVVDTEEDAGLTLTSGQERRDTKEITFTPGADIQTLRVYYSYVTASSKLGIDDVQLEFGQLTDYSENG